MDAMLQSLDFNTPDAAFQNMEHTPQKPQVGGMNNHGYDDMLNSLADTNPNPVPAMGDNYYEDSQYGGNINHVPSRVYDSGIDGMLESLSSDKSDVDSGSDYDYQPHEPQMVGGGDTNPFVHSRGNFNDMLESLALIDQVEDTTTSNYSQPFDLPEQVGGGRKKDTSSIENNIKKLIKKKQKQNKKYLKEENVRKLIQQYLKKNAE